MGTSTSFGGGSNNNPLIPSWIDAETNGNISNNENSKNSGNETPSGNNDDAKVDSTKNNESEKGEKRLNILAPVKPEKRFTAARRNYNDFIKSNGKDRGSMKKAVSNFVRKTSGGSSNASKRMASERRAGTIFANILSDSSKRGLREVIKQYNLGEFENRPVIEIYTALVDIICKPGGDLDDSFSRDAYLDAIAEISEQGIEDLEKPSAETISSIMEVFISNCIYDRILNAIGNDTISLAHDVGTIQSIESQMHDFIRGAVSDAIVKTGNVFPSGKMSAFIDTLFELSFQLMQNLADQKTS